MESILEETNGVIVYQEQIMQIARTIAGYSALEADRLRKVMSKSCPKKWPKGVINLFKVVLRPLALMKDGREDYSIRLRVLLDMGSIKAIQLNTH